MLTREEVSRSLGGAARLFAFDPEGMRAFDVSTNGFFRSFRAILLVLPLVIAVGFAERKLILARGDIEAFDDVAFFVSRVAVVALEWLLFPLVMAAVARAQGLDRRYAAFIVAHNWTWVLSAVLLSIPLIAFGVGLIPPWAAGIIQLGLLVVWVRYSFFTALIALETTWGIAALVVVLDFALGLVLERVASVLIGL